MKVSIDALMKLFLVFSLLLSYFSQSLAQSDQFITIWETTSPNESITIPADNVYLHDISWGDGSSDINISGDATHIYASPGLHAISISGNFPRISFHSPKLKEVTQWGTQVWGTDQAGAFEDCVNLQITATDIPNMTNVENCSRMFKGCSSLTVGLTNWDMGNVNNMGFMFRDASNFTADISGWDVQNVVDMAGMFWGAQNFDQDISGWNTLSLVGIEYMFYNASSFNQDISSWNVSGCTDMSGLFWGATSFNQNIFDWETQGVTNMQFMFFDASSFNQDISNWNVSACSNMNGMFRGASNYNQNMFNWDTQSVTTMTSMFADASSFNQDISSWNVSSCTSMKSMFDGASSFNQDIANWDTQSAANMEFMFSDAVSFNQDISSWLVHACANMRGMFFGATSFNQDLSSWDISSVTNMQIMFTNSGLSSSNYDNILLGWSNQVPNVQPNVGLGANGIDYCLGEAGRSALIGQGWAIVDGDLFCPPIFGCMDATACNYDAQANTDDGSCEYISCLQNVVLEFDGINDNTSQLGTIGTAHTIEFWVDNFSDWSTSSSGASVLMSFDHPDGVFGYIYAGNYAGSPFINEYLTLAVNNGTANGELIVKALSPSQIPSQGWTHIAFVAEGDFYNKCYINGVEAMVEIDPNTNGADPAYVMDITGVHLGELTNTSLPNFKGMMDEVRIWDYARSASQVANTYSSNICSDQEGLLLHYDFQQTSGSLLPNLTSSQNATLIGMDNNNWVGIDIGLQSEVSGCTDPMAANFDTSATCDDGSCIIESNIVLEFDGNNDNTSQIGAIGTAHTIEFWVDNFNNWSTSSSGASVLMSFDHPAGQFGYIYAGNYAGSPFNKEYLTLAVNDGTTNGELIVKAPTSLQLPSQGWTHIAFVAESDHYNKCYINGEEAIVEIDPNTNGAIPAYVMDITGIHLGELLNTTLSNFEGRMDEVRIWDYPKSASQIANTYSTNICSNQEGLLLHYDFQQSSGELLPDMVSGQNAVLSGISNNNWLYLDVGLQDEVNGCTDPLALNFDSFATCDDGSCLKAQMAWDDSTEMANDNREVVSEISAGGKEAFELTIFPNPSADLVHARLSNVIGSEIFNIEVYNLNGKNVLSRTVDSEHLIEGLVRLDFSQLETGIYTVIFKGQNHIVSEKVVKME